MNTTKAQDIYAARNRRKRRYCIHTYEAMWNCAESMARKLYGQLPGRHGASTIVNVALAQFLEKHGCCVAKEIKELNVCRSLCG